MDNLIADGKCAPAIIVMPFGHNVSGTTGKFAEVNFLQKQLGVAPMEFVSPVLPSAGPLTSGSSGFTGAPSGNRGGPNSAASGTGTGTGAAGNAPAAAGARGGVRGGPNLGAAYMESDLLKNVIPLVEREYRVKADKWQRAIVGYSMGAGHSTTIGLNHPELFAYVGAFSGATGEAAIAKALADPAKTNEDFRLIWIGCGTEDATALNGTRNFRQILASKGIQHEWVESPGYRHDYQIWRIYLRDVLPKLFKQ